MAAPPNGSVAGDTVMTVETFDGFSYAAKIGAKQDDNYPVSFMVTANLPATRTPGKEEKPEDKAKLDKDFQTQQKTLADKLAKESACTNWVYQLPGYSLDELLKTRPQLLEDVSTNSTADTGK